MSAVTWVYIVIEVLAALGLIFLILMHSGKGGGLSDMFGGSVGAAAQGSTVVERNLDRITVTVAIVFALTTITLDLRLEWRAGADAPGTGFGWSGRARCCWPCWPLPAGAVAGAAGRPSPTSAWRAGGSRSARPRARRAATRTRWAATRPARRRCWPGCCPAPSCRTW